MSKKKPSPRPRARKADSPRPKPPEKPWLTARKKLLFALGGTFLAGVLGVRAQLGKAVPEKAAVQAPSPEKAPLPVTPYEVWSQAIVLPAVDPRSVEMRLSKEELRRRFAPEIAPEALDHFYAEYDRRLEHFLKIIPAIQAPEERQKAIIHFFNWVLYEHQQATHREPSKEPAPYNSPEFFMKMHELKRVLVPHGKWFHADYAPPHQGARVAFFDIESLREITIHHARTGDLKVPAIFLKNQVSVQEQPDTKSIELNGQYQVNGKYVVVHPEGALSQSDQMIEAIRRRCLRQHYPPRPFDQKQIRADQLAVSKTHEPAHAYFIENGPEFSDKKDGIRRKQSVSMGHYVFPAEQFRPATNAHLHELLANGIGLMNSGTSARITAHAVAGFNELEGYVLARKALLFDIVHSPEVDLKLREELIDAIKHDTVLIDKVAVAINQLSDQSLAEMGRRMAQLGVYLMQE